MAGGLTIRGVIGEVRWSYQVAAALRQYTVTHDRETKAWTLHGTVARADRFKLAQTPLVFVMPTQRGNWRWPVVDWTLTGSTFTARLGPQDKGQEV